MNAILPSPATGANAPLMRQIRDRHAAELPVGLDDLAALNPDSRRDNLKRSLNRLIDDGALTLEGDAYHLTAFGAQALLALDIGEGLVAAGLGFAGAADPTQQPRWPIEDLRPNPDNPRGDDDPALEDDALADSIAEAGDILQPLAVSPPDANGVRIIWAGHRRWRAADRLSGEGRLPPALLDGLPYKEHPVDPGLDDAALRAEGLKVALIENHQRQDITPWEDARALALYAQLTGKSARAVAFALGRAREGSETGVKDVQDKIKVVREASHGAIAAHEAGRLTWEQLRDSVREKKPGLTAKQTLCLVEVCDYAVHRCGALPAGDVVVPVLRPHDHGGDYDLVKAGMLGFSYRGDTVEAILHQAAWDTVQALGQAPDPNEPPERRRDRLAALRETVVSQSRAIAAGANDSYITGWLNRPQADPATSPPAAPKPPVRLGVIDPNDPLVVDGKRFPNMTGRNEYLRRLNREGGASPPRSAKPPAQPPEEAPSKDRPTARCIADEIILIELAHAIDQAQARGAPMVSINDMPGVHVGKYWLDRQIPGLKSDGLIDAGGGTTLPWVCLTAQGAAYLEGRGIHRPINTIYLSNLQAQRASTPRDFDALYNTDWLQNPSPESRPLEPDAEPDANFSPSGEAATGGGGPSPQAMVEGAAPLPASTPETPSPTTPIGDPVIAGLREAAGDLWRAAGEARRVLDNLLDCTGAGDDELAASAKALQAAALTLAPFLTAAQKEGVAA
ncbi:MAG: ParB N-terminal domain-containing protein [Caulobacter sp.]|nr:ParB N-terminal domain-containing protein [Caulobacter sp.]